MSHRTVALPIEMRRVRRGSYTRLPEERRNSARLKCCNQRFREIFYLDKKIWYDRNFISARRHG